jgi:hypothetical protein
MMVHCNDVLADMYGFNSRTEVLAKLHGTFILIELSGMHLSALFDWLRITQPKRVFFDTEVARLSGTLALPPVTKTTAQN